MKWLILLWLIFVVWGCTRTYMVTIHNHGDSNTVNIEVKADVPKVVDVTTNATGSFL